MPSTNQAVINSTLLENYELKCNLKVDGTVPVLKYRSKKTGIHVIIAQVEGPIVRGYFTLGILLFYIRYAKQYGIIPICCSYATLPCSYSIEY